MMLQHHMVIAEAQERKQQYSQTIRDNYQPAICCLRDESIPVFAHAGEPLPDRSMYRMFHRLQNTKISTTDFDVAILVRTLYVTNDDALKTEIVTGMQDLYDKRVLRFWLTEGETHLTYWTENHIILWLSSTWLLRPHLTFREDDDAIIFLETRLRHFLTTTLEKGAYEFFSTNYYPFTLGALLNLYDFAPESEIRNLASQLITRLLGELLLFVNDEGSFYPVAGRNMIHRYVPQPFISMVWFLTGKGPGPTKHDFFGSFMATSTFDLTDIIATWTPIVDTKFSIGHSTVKELKATHQDLPSRSDRVMFQWSASAYAEPEAVSDTAWVIGEFALNDHVLLNGLGVIATVFRFGFDIFWQMIFRILGGQTEGWDIMGADVSIFKHNGVVLSSLEDFNVGNRGTQQWPWMAVVNNIPVWTQSGVAGPTFENLSFGEDTVVNTHLPQVVQTENVCLIAYKPRPGVYLIQPIFALVGLDGFTTGVGLYFPSNEFDEVRENGRWIMGRKGGSYIGIWRHSTSRTDCSGQEESCLSYYFSDPKLYGRAQSWAAVVGNGQTHGSFESFYGTVSQGTITEKKPSILRWLLSLFTRASSYESLLTVDGKTVKATI